MKIENRILVSFDHQCIYECKHCYTYGIVKPTYERSIDEIVNEIENDHFDVVYVSQKNDNFSCPNKGIELCEKLYEKYNCNIFAITRNVFLNEDINRLKVLSDKMKKNGKIFVIAVSVFALKSASLSENLAKIPTPEERINFLVDLKNRDLNVILMLRPVYPEKIIPINELEMLLERCGNNICVVTGGLGINDDILQRINKNREDFIYDENNNEYLKGAINCEIKFVDVKKELIRIEEKCRELSMPFFIHSMPALNYIVQNTSFR